jgi:uncharacterized protein (TIGR03437 family)
MRPHSRLINRMTIAALAVIILITFIVVSQLTGNTGISHKIMGHAAAQSPGTIVSVNGASYTAPIARGSFAILRGTNMATQTVVGQAPYSTQLGGTTVTLTDANNVQFSALLIYVSPVQINYFVNDNVALGTMTITVTNGNGLVQTGTAQVTSSAPALFTFGTTGRGVPLGFTTYDGYTGYIPLANNNSDGTNTPIAIDMGAPWKRNILVLKGTGVRYASNVSVRIGNMDCTVSNPICTLAYVGPSGSAGESAIGFDQMNLLIQGTNIAPGTANVSVIADGQVSNATQITFVGLSTGAPNLLSLSDVQTIINQCVQRAKQLGIAGTCAITDREGNALAVFQMNGANPMTRITANQPMDQGLEGLLVPALAAAVSKAGTASFFSTQGSAINTRSASFIIREHFPPNTPLSEGGPLFGVQFSQLPCSDVRAAALPLGLSGDLGSASIYKYGDPNGPFSAGGIGFESNATYTIDQNIADLLDSFEEDVAVASTFGFDTPTGLRIDNVRVNGVPLPFVNYPQNGGPAPPVTAADGQYLLGPRAAPPSRYILTTIGGVPVKFDPRFFPPRASTVPGPNQLTAADVMQILTQGVQGAYQMRAAIRTQSPDQVEVNVTVVDTNGAILGILSTVDAPEFGFDVSAQKARTANLFSSPNTQALLQTAANIDNSPLPVGPNIAAHVNAALAIGFPLDGSLMFSSRGMGFAARPFLPDGQDAAPPGPFSRPINVWSPFNVGIQLQLVLNDLAAALGLGGAPPTPSIPCTAIPITGNGLQIFAGSSVLFKGGMRAGAVGVSGDGIDQDDLTSAAGARGFEAPQNLNSTNLVLNINGAQVRFPYLRYPPFPCIQDGCPLITIPGQGQ